MLIQRGDPSQHQSQGNIVLFRWWKYMIRETMIDAEQEGVIKPMIENF